MRIAPPHLCPDLAFFFGEYSSQTRFWLSKKSHSLFGPGFSLFEIDKNKLGILSRWKVSKKKHLLSVFMSRNGVIRWRFETFVSSSSSGLSSSLKLFKTVSVETFESPGPLISDHIVKIFFLAIKFKMFSPLIMATSGSWCVVGWSFQEAKARSVKSSKMNNFASGDRRENLFQTWSN